ncbi:MAG: dihydrodipicolinate synthase family protein [Lautropia sp.]|nr:dihydrodipicolinate synthase family protein [Lautropia sp.]
MNLNWNDRPLITTSTRGIFTEAISSFTEDGTLDLDGIRAQMDFSVAAGASGVLLLGAQAEVDKLSNDERLSVVRAGIRHLNGRIPAIVDISEPGIDNLALLGRRVMDAGAAGVRISPDRTLRTDDDIYTYFERVSTRLGEIPWVLHDQPMQTGVYIAPYLLIRMLQDFERMAGLCQGSDSGLDKAYELRDAETKGIRRVAIFEGNDGMHFPQALERNIDGAFTAFAYPEALIKQQELFDAGKRDDAEDIFDAYLPLMRHQHQPTVGLGVLKQLLKLRGIIRSARLREPARRLNEAEQQDIERLVRRMDRRTRQLGIGLPTPWPPRHHG